MSAVTLAATACSSGTGASSGGDSLRISAVATDRAGTEAVIKAFKEKNPGVEITTAYADTDQYQGTLRTQLSSGTAPDVFFAWPGNGNPGAIEVLDQLWPNPKVQQAHFTGVQEMFAGEADPASVLKDMDAAYKEK